MNDFEHRLTALLDDVASSVRPHPDPDGLFVPMVTPVPNDVHIFRPRWVAVAAASLVLVGGSAFAMERITNDPPSRVVPAASPVDEPTSVSPTTTIEPTSTTLVTETKPATESVFKPILVPDATVRATEPTEPIVTTVAPTEPTVAPVVIEFTAKLGANGRANTR